VPGRSALSEFEVADPAHPGNWLLRRGASMTLGEVLEHRRLHGWEGEIDPLVAAASERGIGAEEEVFRVSSAGYKGPELGRDAKRLRVLALGDSCTFGSLLDRASYPRELERSLAEHGIASEVVNGGVDSYYPAHILARIDEFRALRPQVVVLYVGCNALYGERGAVDLLADRLYVVRAFRTLARWFDPRVDPRAALARREVLRSEALDLRDPVIARVANYEPSFLPDVERIARELEGAGARIFLVTLPSLYSLERTPSAAALHRGQLPSFTDNAYVLARMVDRYNFGLGELAREGGFSTIHAAAWAEAHFIPAEAYFEGALQLNVTGQQALGAWIAEVLAEKLAARPAPAP
jgi:lysophospholipase L1-like esterase